jgi:acyl-CoA thioesterase FadM
MTSVYFDLSERKSVPIPEPVRKSVTAMIESGN